MPWNRVTRYTKQLSLKQHWIYIVIAIYVLFVWIWLPFVEVSNLSASPLLGRFISVGVYVLLVGISLLILVAAARYLRQQYATWRRPDWQFLVLMFLTWALAEWAASWFVTVIWFGEGASFDSVLPFASLTPFLMYTPLGLLTRFLGFHGLSAIIVTAIVALSVRRLRRFALPITMALLLIMGLSFFIYRQADGERIQAVVTAERLDSQLPAIKTSADLVILPEYGLDSIEEADLRERIVGTENKKVFFVGSRQVGSDMKIKNNLLFGSTQQGYINEVVKSRLIPGGEYLPYLVELPLRIIGAESVLQNFELTRTIAKGDYAAKPFIMKPSVYIGAEACASIITPNDYRILTQQGATVLVNAASLEIFRSPIFDAQHLGLARFMAVANARPMLQAANSGSAFILDHNGKISAKTSPVGMEEASVTTNNKTTFYQIAGEWPVYTGAVILLVQLAKYLKRRRKA